MKKRLRNNPTIPPLKSGGTTYKEGGWDNPTACLSRVKSGLLQKAGWCDNPIGVFDSGVGGLTVVKELAGLLPHEDIIYFGDTARVPYGTKSRDAIIGFSCEIVDFLIKKNVKLILVACNTASALALNTIRKKTRVPILGVIEPGAVSAVSASRNRKIGIIGTEATIKSRAYEKVIKKTAKGYRIVSRACPLFVPIAEEGWMNKKVSEIIAGEYLGFVKKAKVDTVILGCTHYPLLKNVIGKVLGKNIKLIDSSAEVAARIKNVLQNKKLLNSPARAGRTQFFVSDAPEKFKRLGKLFLGKKIMAVSKVNLTK